MKLTSKDIKKHLQALTKTPAKDWSRWAKYKVGSKSDLTAKDQPGGDPGRGLNFASSHPQFKGCTVRVYGAPSDQPMLAAAIFERMGSIVHVEDLSSVYPNLGIVLDPGTMPQDVENQTTYNVVITSGYVEEASAAKLWFNYRGNIDLTPKQIAFDLKRALISYLKEEEYKQNDADKECCKAAKKNPKKNKRFCSSCGRSLTPRTQEDYKEEAICLFRDIMGGTCDSIASYGDTYVEDHLEEQGWTVWGRFIDGPVVIIDAFDSFLEWPEAKWHKFHSFTAKFEGNKK